MRDVIPQGNRELESRNIRRETIAPVATSAVSLDGPSQHTAGPRQMTVPRYLSVSDAAVYASVSTMTIRRMVRRREISGAKFGSDLRIDRWSMDAWAAGPGSAMSPATASHAGARPLARKSRIRYKQVTIYSPV